MGEGLEGQHHHLESVVGRNTKPVEVMVDGDCMGDFGLFGYFSSKIFIGIDKKYRSSIKNSQYVRQQFVHVSFSKTSHSPSVFIVTDKKFSLLHQ